jgi:hypothetical protein
MIGFGTYGLTHQNNFEWGEAAVWVGLGGVIAVTVGTVTYFITPWIAAAVGSGGPVLINTPLGQKAIQWLTDPNRINHVMRHQWDLIIKLTKDATQNYRMVQQVCEVVLKYGQLIGQDVYNGVTTYYYPAIIDGYQVIVEVRVVDGVLQVVNAWVATQ